MWFSGGSTNGHGAASRKEKEMFNDPDVIDEYFMLGRIATDTALLHPDTLLPIVSDTGVSLSNANLFIYVKEFA